MFWLPTRVRALSALFALSLIAALLPLSARAQNLTSRQLNSLNQDGAAPVSDAYYQTIAGFDGTNAQALSTNTSGELLMTFAAGSGIIADNGVFTDGTSLVVPAGFIFDETAGTSLTENDVAAGRIDSKRAQVFVLEDETTRGLWADILDAGADDLATSLNRLNVAAELYGFDGTTMDRIRGGATNTDDVATTATTTNLSTNAFLMAYDGTDWDRLRLDASNGNLLVAGPVADNAAFTDGTTRVFPGGYIYDDVAGTALVENDVAAARMNSLRAQVFTLEDGATRSRWATVRGGSADDESTSFLPLWTASILMGFDGTNHDRLRLDASNGNLLVAGPVADNAAFTDGTTRVDPAGFIFDETAGTALTENDAAAARIDSKRAQVMVIEDETTRGLWADILADGADDSANTLNSVITGSQTYGYHVADGNWDRVASFAQANNLAPSTTEGQMLSTAAFLYVSDGSTFDSVESGSTATDNQSTNADGNLTTLTYLYLFDGTNWDRAESSVTNADDVGVSTTGGVLRANSYLLGFDGTTFDRIRSYAANADSITNPTLGNLGVTGFTYGYDSSGGNWDRLSTVMVAGAHTPGTNINVTATSTEVCTTDNVLTVGTVYAIQTAAAGVFCELGADAATIAAATTDTPLFPESGVYNWYASSTSFDTLCCITSGASIEVDLYPLTF